MLLPPEAAPLVALFAAEFTAPTAARFHTLFAAALLTTGRRTVVARCDPRSRFGLRVCLISSGALSGGIGRAVPVPPERGG